MNTHSDFASRHIGPQGEERREMLDSLGYRTLDELIADIVPADIRAFTSSSPRPTSSNALIMISGSWLRTAPEESSTPLHTRSYW